jgi:hypothetical protein
MIEVEKEEVIKDWIEELRSNWKPRIKKETGYGYHGSSKGEKEEYTYYFDEYRYNWTVESIAFQGYVFKHINELIKDKH